MKQYLISLFLITTAQTREFPMILVVMSEDVIVVMATSADSDMIGGCQRCLRNLDKNKTN